MFTRLLLFVFVLPTMCLAQEIFRGGEVILSTRHDYNTVQAYLDTVLVFARENHTQNCKVYSLEPRSSVWDSASVVGQTAADQSQRTAFMAGSGYVRYSQDSGEYRIWTCKTAKDVVFHSNEYRNLPVSKLAVSNLTAHPYLPGVLIAENYVENPDAVNDIEIGSVSLDAGGSWNSVEITAGQQFFISFDPNSLLKVTITREDGPSVGFHYYTAYETKDLFSSMKTIGYSAGESDIKRNLMGVGFGVWSRLGSIEQGQPFGLNRFDWNLLSDSLYLPPNSAPARVTLPWRENARRAFYPDLDTATEKFSYWSIEMAYHIDHPKLLVTSFFCQRNVGNLYENSIVVGASTDLGETWSLLAKLPYHYLDNPVFINQLTIDPKGPTLYLAVTRMIDDSLSPGKRIKVSQVIRWKQALTSVKEDNSYRSPFTVHVSPNPLNGSGLMRFTFTQNEHAESMPEDAPTDVALYSALGVNVGVWRIGSEGIISLPGLTAGVYQVRAVREGHTSYTSFVVAE